MPEKIIKNSKSYRIEINFQHFFFLKSEDVRNKNEFEE